MCLLRSALYCNSEYRTLGECGCCQWDKSGLGGCAIAFRPVGFGGTDNESPASSQLQTVIDRCDRRSRCLQLLQLTNPPLHHLAELFDVLWGVASRAEGIANLLRRESRQLLPHPSGVRARDVVAEPEQTEPPAHFRKSI